MFYLILLTLNVPLQRGKCTPSFILLRLNPFRQKKLPIVISLSRMLWFGRVCAFPCALNVSAALQGAYITPFHTEVIRAIRAQRDEANVSKIVCYLHVMASCPASPPVRAPHPTIFILLRLNPLSQRKLPMVISLSRMLCLGRYALLLALSV